MKLRNGFVSNSSSSSFICNFCGDIESGYDSSITDFDMSICEHGHTFCNHHAIEMGCDFLNEASIEEKYEYIKNYYERYSLKANLESLEEDYKNLSEDEFEEEYLEEIMNIIVEDGVPEKYCPVCNRLKEYKKDPEFAKFLELRSKFEIYL